VITGVVATETSPAWVSAFFCGSVRIILTPGLPSPYRGETRHPGGPMAERRLTLSPDELATLATVVVRYPGLASTVHAQVRRLVGVATSSPEMTLTSETQVDELLGQIVDQVVEGTGPRDPATPQIVDEAVETMVLLLARSSAAGARRWLVERVKTQTGAEA
jgi:hypothetical protein